MTAFSFHVTILP